MGFICDQCGKTWPSASKLKIHYRTHTGERPYKCDQCGTIFKKSADLISHMRVHTGEKPYSCDICGQRFGYKSEVWIQAFSQGTLERGLLSVTSVEKTFRTKGELSVHQRVHRDERSYQCEQCWKAFRTSQTLSTHYRTHTGEKPYSCNQCGKEFSQSSSCKRHLRIHSGEKPYKCEYCSKTFRNLANLTVHRRIHTGEKPYVCGECGKAFVSTLKHWRHIKVCHYEEKSCSSDQCGRAFRKPGDFKVRRLEQTEGGAAEAGSSEPKVRL